MEKIVIENNDILEEVISDLKKDLDEKNSLIKIFTKKIVKLEILKKSYSSVVNNTNKEIEKDYDSKIATIINDIKTVIKDIETLNRRIDYLETNGQVILKEANKTLDEKLHFSKIRI